MLVAPPVAAKMRVDQYPVMIDSYALQQLPTEDSLVTVPY